MLTTDQQQPCDLCGTSPYESPRLQAIEMDDAQIPTDDGLRMRMRMRMRVRGLKQDQGISTARPLMRPSRRR